MERGGRFYTSFLSSIGVLECEVLVFTGDECLGQRYFFGYIEIVVEELRLTCGVLSRSIIFTGYFSSSRFETAGISGCLNGILLWPACVSMSQIGNVRYLM